ncbi:zinc finger MYM-type protein 1-like [Lissotriton helveticus]
MSKQPRKYLSGAQKRQIKSKQEQFKGKFMKIDSMFRCPGDHDASSSHASLPEGNAAASSSTEDKAALPQCQLVPPPDKISQCSDQTTNVPFSIEAPIEESEDIMSKDVEFHLEELESSNSPFCQDLYPSDRGNFLDKPWHDAELRRFVIRSGPCKPIGPFPRDNKNRCFSTKYYYKENRTGDKTPRLWLCYSLKMDSAYCEPCWLFGDRTLSSYQQAWANGIKDWQGMSREIKEHEMTRSHLVACAVHGRWRQDETIDTQLESDYKEQVNYWTQILSRIIDIALLLSTCNLPFRGHREQVKEKDGGNFLAVIELLAKYDPILNHLITKDSRVKYLSPAIQNELIEMLSNKVQNEIVSEIKNAPFYSVILDTTQDIKKEDQLSLVIRYVTLYLNNDEIPTEIKINESFVGFYKITDQSAEGIATELVKLLEDKGLVLNKCRGQGYDGASSMSVIYSGVQTRIRQKEPNAVYVHCAAHNLNLVLNDACMHIPEISEFYDILQKVYLFFSQSIKRWELLTTTKESTTHSKPTLKRLCPTHWASRQDALHALRYRFMDIMKALATILLQSKKVEERTEARGLMKCLETFEFVLMVVIQSKVLETINIVSKLLQSKDLDLLQASNMLSSAANTFASFREQFEDVKSSASLLAAAWGIQLHFTQKRPQHKILHFDELFEDQRLCNPEDNFKVSVFYANLDIVVNQIKTRFAGINTISQCFHFMMPSEILRASEEELFEAAMTLAAHYEKDLSLEFPQQLIAFKAVLKEQIQLISGGTIKDLADLLFLRNHAILPSVLDVATALKLFLTIPVTVANAERSFTKLKLIKNYLRSTMPQERLSGLATLSIESDLAKKINVRAVTEEFTQRKARRQTFFQSSTSPQFNEPSSSSLQPPV